MSSPVFYFSDPNALRVIPTPFFNSLIDNLPVFHLPYSALNTHQQMSNCLAFGILNGVLSYIFNFMFACPHFYTSGYIVISFCPPQFSFVACGHDYTH